MPGSWLGLWAWARGNGSGLWPGLWGSRASGSLGEPFAGSWALLPSWGSGFTSWPGYRTLALGTLGSGLRAPVRIPRVCPRGTFVGLGFGTWAMAMGPGLGVLGSWAWASVSVGLCGLGLYGVLGRSLGLCGSSWGSSLWGVWPSA